MKLKEVKGIDDATRNAIEVYAETLGVSRSEVIAMFHDHESTRSLIGLLVLLQANPEKLRENALESRGLGDADVIRAMREFGGGFVSALGEAWGRADADNARRLRAAFPEVWSRYADVALGLEAN